jgi:hypothetical protein
MSLKPIPLTAALLPCLMLIGTCASAGDDHDHDHGHHDHDDHGHDEHRQHGTHVHGIAALNLASEGKEVHVELDSPAANIVGFEHAPSSAEDRAALDQAIATLSDGAALLAFNAMADPVRLATLGLEEPAEPARHGAADGALHRAQRHPAGRRRAAAHEARASFANTLSGTDLIVGARSGPVQLLLYSVFRIGDATNNISWESYQDIAAHPKVAWTVPISLGDSHRGFRVLGTTPGYFEHYRYARDRRW